MKDMLETLRKARQNSLFLDQQEFKNILMKIQRMDMELELDWDDGAGEEWARLSNWSDGIVCMINVKLRLVFIRKKYKIKNIEKILEGFEIVFTENYDSEDWSMDVGKLESEIPEINWHASEDAVNTSCFSLNDFYFATV